MKDTRLFVEGYGDKTLGRLANLIADAKGDNLLSPVTVVVPTTYCGLFLRHALGKGKGLVNVRFMVLPRLAEYLGASTLAGKSPLSSTMKLAAIRHFAKDMATMEPLGAVAGHPPLHNYLMSTFSDLSTLSQESISILQNKSPLLQQVVEWYQLYQGLISKYYDREELAHAATKALSKRSTVSVLKDMGFIVFYLVTNFTPGELALISALGVNRLCAVVLGLVGEEEVDSETYKLASKLESALGKAKVTSAGDENYGANHITIAVDAREEVRWVIRHIVQNAEQGVPFHRMAVLYRNADPYAALVKNQLDMAKIPMAGPDPLPLRDTPAGKLLIYLLEVFESDFARESIMRWVAEAPVCLEGSDESALRELAVWEAISTKAGIIKGAQQWLDRLDNFCKGISEKMGSEGADEDGEPSNGKFSKRLLTSGIRLKSFIEELAANQPPHDGSSWKKYANWASRMTKKYASHKSGPQKQLDCYDKIIAKLDELSSIDIIETKGTTLADFRQMLDDSLRSASGRLGPMGSGIFVAPVGAAQGMEFEVVYVLGMVEGAFPPTLPDDAIIPDRYRNDIGDIDQLKLRAATRIDERRVFRAAMAAGRKRFISYPRSGSAGQRRGYPSPWLIREAEALHQRGAKSTHSGKETSSKIRVSSANLEEFTNEQWLSIIHSAQHSLESLGGLVAADIHDYDMNSLAKWQAGGQRLDGHFLMAEGSISHRALELERARRGQLFTEWDGNISALAGKSARLGIPQEQQYSPTRLELWATCPFRYFMQNVLLIAVLERPEEIITISPLDRGRLVHTILERFMIAAEANKRMPEHGQPWTATHRGLLMDIAQEEFSKVESQGLTGRPLFWKVAQHEIQEDLSVFLAKDSKLRVDMASKPVAVEFKFGFGKVGQGPPVVLKVNEDCQVCFRGVIDRVDTNVSKSKLLVLDYKTGSSYPFEDMNDDPLVGGRHLQLPVYAMAIRKHFGDKCDIEAAYWFISAKGGFEMKTVILSQVLENNFMEVIRVIASGIVSGLFPGNPGDGGEGYNNCTYCDYRRVCPANPDIIWERKSQNPELAEYVKLTGSQVVEESEE